MENKILNKITYSVDIKYFNSLTLFTILSCYIIAVLKGDVPVWLPYISDCAVGYPEAYIFRSGMSTVYFLNTVTSLFSYTVPANEILKIPQR